MQVVFREQCKVCREVLLIFWKDYNLS